MGILSSRIASVALAGALCLSLCPGYVLAEESNGVQEGSTAVSSSESADQTGQTGDSSGSDSTVVPAPEKKVPSITRASKSGKWTYKKKGKKKVKVSFRYKDHTYPTSITRIGSSTYYFDSSNGKLKTSSKKKRLVTVDGEHFVVGPSGKLLGGWQVVGKSLYYLGGTYLSARTNKTVDDIALASTGKAKKNLNAGLRIRCIELLEKVSNRSSKRSKQLRDVWRYLTSKKHFKYELVPVNIKRNDWVKRYAYQMFKTHSGDCYGFAAMLGTVADFLGYKVVMITCRVPGSRDHAADGFTRHGLLTINGRYYDPEAEFAGWCNGVYNLSHYPMPIKARKNKKYKSFVGVGPARGITEELGNSVKLSVEKKGNLYYGYSTTGGKRKKLLTGLYCINGKLYKFSSKGKISISAFKKLKKASAAKASWSGLKRYIGSTKSVTSGASCYGEGTDHLYTFKHVCVATFEPSDGSVEIVLSYRSR